jgi:hypothetical protein
MLTRGDDKITMDNNNNPNSTVKLNPTAILQVYYRMYFISLI